MRAGLSTIQQTLTPEAASVLSQSISEAARRSHGQTTPLHVAASLLASPSGFLRQACIKSHPNSSHPLQCRALELCFSVALDRLPTVSGTALPEPPISNALMAALKRAQAHQRRGCPEIQQQPILAVKVELEQLVISILDDPSVSRVMREASFSSPAVKATIERSLSGSANPTTSIEPPPIGLGLRPVPSRNLYLNPRLQQNGAVQSGEPGSEDVKRVRDVLLRTKKRNPVLVGESEAVRVASDVIKKVESGEFGDGSLRNVGVLHLEKELGPGKVLEKIEKLRGLIETRITNIDRGGIILDLGDLKWLGEQNISSGMAQQPQAGAEAGCSAIAEIRKLLERFGERLWLIAVATCETFLRCRVYYPSMENEWDLQAVPVAARAPLPGAFPRLGSTGILNAKMDSLSSPLKSLSTVPTTLSKPVGNNTDVNRGMSCCPQCLKHYEKELSDLERSSSEAKPEGSQQKLPRWLQNAKTAEKDIKESDQASSKDQAAILNQGTQEMQKKWNDTCMRLHPYHHRSNLLLSERIVPSPISLTGPYNRNALLRQNLQPKPQLTLQTVESLQLSSNQLKSPPRSPVRTDLALGRPKVTDVTETQEVRVKDFLGCISSEQQKKFQAFATEELGNSLDIDLLKKLRKGMSEKVSWQHDAASAVAATVSQCKLGNKKRRGGDIWLLFTGPDRVGKKKMASALSEVLYGADPIVISLGSRRGSGEADIGLRGKTVLDKIAETVKRSPSAVVILEDFDEASVLLRGSIKRAMERGRLSDSYGREISLGNVIFILTVNFSANGEENLRGCPINEAKLTDLVTGGWQLKLSVCKKSLKRGPSWMHDDEGRPRKPRTELGLGLSFDLNEAADADNAERADVSHNSSDLTVDHDQEPHPILSSSHRELVGFVDDAIAFKPVDFGPVKRDIKDLLADKFSAINNHDISFEIHEDAVERIAGAHWLGEKSLEEWSEKVFVPSLRELKPLLFSGAHDGPLMVRLELDDEAEGRAVGDFFPSLIRVVVGN